MKKEKKKKFRKKRFPLGIFILLLTVESLIVAAGVTLYFVDSCKKTIADIEKYTRNYSITMAEAIGDVAAINYRTRRYGDLVKLFRNKIKEDTVDEAFFVLNNGAIIVHSKKDIQKELDGNIVNDEFSYNIEMILRPVEKKSREVFFSDYHVMTSRPPFNRQERELIKEYIYPDVNATGWLVNRAVYYGRKPVGTVNFIISKNRIYTSIRSNFEESKKYGIFGIAGAALISFMISLIIWLRYRSIQRKTLKQSGIIPASLTAEDETVKPAGAVAIAESQEDLWEKDEYITIDISAHERNESQAFPKVPEAAEMQEQENDFTDSIDLSDMKAVDAKETARPVPSQAIRPVKDAIPINRKVDQ